MFGIRQRHHRKHGIGARKDAWSGIRIIVRDCFRAARQLCFPSQCLVCGRGLPGDPEVRFCENCATGVRLLHEPCCLTCGKPFFNSAGSSHLCSACLTGNWHYSQTRGVVCYGETIAPLLHAFKYHGHTSALRTFASLKKQLPHLRDFEKDRIILPVPLHPKRLRRRGYNQALLLAKAFFPHKKHLINITALERWRPTRPQTGLSGTERRRNIKGAFRTIRPEQIAGRRVLLLDDVYTTGATVNECSRVLRQAGATDIRVLTLARVEK